jgi:hypothetical protein
LAEISNNEPAEKSWRWRREAEISPVILSAFFPFDRANSTRQTFYSLFNLHTLGDRHHCPPADSPRSFQVLPRRHELL